MPFLLLVCSVIYNLADQKVLGVCCFILAILCWLVVYGETKQSE